MLRDRAYTWHLRPYANFCISVSTLPSIAFSQSSASLPPFPSPIPSHPKPGPLTRPLAPLRRESTATAVCYRSVSPSPTPTPIPTYQHQHGLALLYPLRSVRRPAPAPVLVRPQYPQLPHGPQLGPVRPQGRQGHIQDLLQPNTHRPQPKPKPKPNFLCFAFRFVRLTRLHQPFRPRYHPARRRNPTAYPYQAPRPCSRTPRPTPATTRRRLHVTRRPSEPRSSNVFCTSATTTSKTTTTPCQLGMNIVMFSTQLYSHAL